MFLFLCFVENPRVKSINISVSTFPCDLSLLQFRDYYKNPSGRDSQLSPIAVASITNNVIWYWNFYIYSWVLEIPEHKK